MGGTNAGVVIVPLSKDNEVAVLEYRLHEYLIVIKKNKRWAKILQGVTSPLVAYQEHTRYSNDPVVRYFNQAAKLLKSNLRLEILLRSLPNGL